MSSDSEIDVVGVEEEQNPTTSSRVKKAYSIERKIEVIEFAKKNSNYAAARRFGVSRSSVIDWIAQEGKLRESKRSNKRLPGGGRSLRFMESDEQLANWVRERRKEKIRVTRRMIQQQAIKMFPLDDEMKFKASVGWLNKFMERHKFSVRVPTTVCQKVPADYANVLVNFVLYISQLRDKNKYSHIYAADETSVWLDASAGKCVTNRGEKQVAVLTTGHDKLRVTVMLTGREDGYKLVTREDGYKRGWLQTSSCMGFFPLPYK